MSRSFVIGDVHGGFRALRQVIERAAPQSDDRLIFLGDYVDGWSETPQVIDYLIALSSRFECIFILGNHDMWCVEWLCGLEADPNWLLHGGQATVDSYAGIQEDHRLRHILFFERTVPYFEDGHRRLFIHAGFSSLHGPANEHSPSNYFWDRTLWETALAVDSRISTKSPFYPRRLLLYDEIFIGHTPTTNYGEDVPMHRCNVWDIDTGAAFDGRITVMDVDSKRYWQSDVVQTLYPGERGRNK